MSLSLYFALVEEISEKETFQLLQMGNSRSLETRAPARKTLHGRRSEDVVMNFKYGILAKGQVFHGESQELMNR